MKLIKVEDITGEEILAVAVITEGYRELLSEGTKVKKEYISKLIDLGINEIFIKDDGVETKSFVILKDEINKKCKEQIREVISKHTYNDHSGKMEQIAATADDIISNIMEEEQVIEHIYDIKERSADLYEHCISTCSLAMLVSLKIGLDKELVHDIGVGCLLHDIGLRYILVDYVNTFIDSMKEKDIEEFKKHTVYGYSAVKDEEWLSKISKEIILCHHERIDGSGFPLKLKDVPLPVKIVAVCDFFDESICGIGNVRLKVHEVVEYLKIHRGITFDTKVVDELLEFTAVYPTGSKVLTSNGEIAVVISQNKGFPERPVIQLLIDKEGNVFEKETVVDLMERNNLIIESVLS